MNVTELFEVYEYLHPTVLHNPHTLAPNERMTWRQFRNEIERRLFSRAPSPSADRRELLRIPFSATVRYWNGRELKTQWVHVLGEGGLYLQTNQPFPAGSLFDLYLAIPKKNFLMNLETKVVWVNRSGDPQKQGMGIQFINLSLAKKAALHGLMRQVLEEKLAPSTC